MATEIYTTDATSTHPTLPTTSHPLTTPHTINIGTRKSALARAQTSIVVSLLQSAHPQHTYTTHAISTMGDKNQITALHDFGAKSLWTHELEAMLMGREIDFIVHSLKDVPTHLPVGCALGAILPREDPRDALVLHPKFFKEGVTSVTLATLPEGSVIGTSSVRRSAQLKRLYPHLDFMSVRGNVGTRLSKLDAEDGPYAGIILAAAGLIRVDLGHRINGFLESRNVEGDASHSSHKHAHMPTHHMPGNGEGTDHGAEARDIEGRQDAMGDRHWGMLHAVGQGALGIEIREGDERVEELLMPLKCVRTSLACLAERSLMRTLEGGCSVPIGVETEWGVREPDAPNRPPNNEQTGDDATMRAGVDATPRVRPKLTHRSTTHGAPESTKPESPNLTMRAIVVSLDGTKAAEAEVTKVVISDADADDFGREVALLLSQRGADKILAEINLDRDVIEKQEGGA